MQYTEFAAFVKEKEGELRELYCHLDVDGNGVLSRDEILAALDTLGLKADAQRLDAMITAMDSDSDGAISFSDFRTMLLLFPSTTHHRVFDAWTVRVPRERTPDFLCVRDTPWSLRACFKFLGM
jgi:hypothetical protein